MAPLPAFLFFLSWVLAPTAAWADFPKPPMPCAPLGAPDLTMPFGPTQGQPITTRDWRPIQRLAETGEGLWVAHYKHGGLYGYALIPSSQLEAAAFVLDLGPDFSHAMLKLTFSESSPILFYRPSADGQCGEPVEIRDTVVSIDAFWSRHDRFGIFPGLLPNRYAQAYRWMSAEQAARSSVQASGRTLSAYRLDLNSTELTRLINNAVDNSISRTFYGPYHTAFKNCSTQLFRLLDQSLDAHPIRNIRSWINRPYEIKPEWAITKLSAVGLIQLDSPFNSVTAPDSNACADRLKGN